MMRNIAWTIAAACAVAIATAAHADDAVQTPLRDPYVPPATLKSAVIAPPLRGDAIRTRVEEKMRSTFDAADVQRVGSLTREQALAGGLGLIAQNFERIDRAGMGRVTYADFLRFLRARGADL